MSAPIEHGGALDAAIAAHGGKRADWLDLSTGINPVAYPVPELSAETWSRLPDRAALDTCIEAARRYYRVPVGAGVTAAPGTQAILQWLPHLFAGRDAAVVSPAYGEYAQTFELADRAVNTISCLDEATGDGHSVIIAGHPNNPDGRMVDPAAVTTLLATGTVVIIDEAFGDVMPEDSLVPLAGRSGLVVLKSFGKFFGLAGLRLGFAIGEAQTMTQLAAMVGPWAVSGPALAIGAAAMNDIAWIDATRHRLAQDRVVLEDMLERHGFSLVGATDLFVTVAHVDAGAIRQALAQQHILVRGFSYAPTWLRFGLPADETDFARLDAALREVIYR